MHQVADNLKLVIFDCDGVLVDSERLSNKALVDCLADLHFEMTVDEAVERFTGRNLLDCFREIQMEHDILLPISFENSFRQRRKLYFETHLQPIDGVAAALKKIPHLKCVASNGPYDMIKRNLAITDLAHHFNENIFSAYAIQRWKPEPDLFLHACSTMGFKVENCVVVEDSKSGVAAACAAGMKVLAYGFEPVQNKTAICFKEMSDLPYLIDQLFFHS